MGSWDLEQNEAVTGQEKASCWKKGQGKTGVEAVTGAGRKGGCCRVGGGNSNTSVWGWEANPTLLLGSVHRS